MSSTIGELVVVMTLLTVITVALLFYAVRRLVVALGVGKESDDG